VEGLISEIYEWSRRIEDSVPPNEHKSRNMTETFESPIGSGTISESYSLGALNYPGEAWGLLLLSLLLDTTEC
jgi:hypothetical protein